MKITIDVPREYERDFYANKSGGVWSTICKAQKAGKKIIYCPKEILERE